MHRVTLFEFRFSPFFEVEQVFDLLKWYCNKCNIENKWSLHVIKGSECLDSAAWSSFGGCSWWLFWLLCRPFEDSGTIFFSFCKYFALALFITRWMLLFVEYIYHIYKKIGVSLEVGVKAGSSVCFCWNRPQVQTQVCKQNMNKKV